MAAVLTRLVQMEVVPGAPRDNMRRMLAALDRARADGIANRRVGGEQTHPRRSVVCGDGAR